MKRFGSMSERVKYHNIVLLMVTFFCIGMINAANGEESSTDYHPILVSHRGANREADENTLKAYSKAAEYGMDYIECDPRLTKDGYFVIMHDPVVDRTTNGKGKISEMTLSEIKKLKTKRGESVPTLDEVFTLAKEKDLNVYLDTKQYTDDYMEKLTAKIAEMNMSKDVMVGLWTVDQLKWMQKNHPEMATSIPYPSPVPSITTVKKMGADWVGTEVFIAKKDMIEKVGKAGLKMITMPINDKETIKEKMKDGLQVIQTDDPALLRSVVNEMK